MGNLKKLKVSVVFFWMLISATALWQQAAFAESYAKDGFFVKTKSEALFSRFLAAREAPQIMSMESFALVPNLHYVKVMPGTNLEAAMERFSKQDFVEYTGLNFKRSVALTAKTKSQLFKHINFRDSTPAPFPKPIDKPAPPTVWDSDPYEAGNYASHMSNAHHVWDRELGNPNMIIADIDTGVDYNHEDLAANLWHNAGEEGLDAQGRDKRTNGVDDDGNGFIDDYIGWNFVANDNLPYDDFGHGTHTSGIAAAVGGNGVGISGVCPRCSIMALKFIGADGNGDDLAGVKAIEYAVKMGAKVLNCSWGGKDYSPELLDAFKAADKAGVLLAVAAGNEGQDIGTNAFYPAIFNLPNQLTVAALYETDVFIPVWSNYSSDLVHISEAGYEVHSTVPGGYGIMSGTSMATPGIAGAAALIWSYRPGLTAGQIKGLMKDNIIPDRGSISRTVYHGRPNVEDIFNSLNK